MTNTHAQRGLTAIAVSAAALLNACGGGGGDAAPNPRAQPDTALGCLAPGMFANGYRDALVYVSTQQAQGAAAVTGALTIASVVITPVVVNGVNTAAVSTVESSTIDGTTSTTSYEAISGTRRVQYRLQDTSSVLVTQDYNPGTYIDFGLASGSSTSQPYTRTETTAGVPGSSVTSELDNIQFVGLETLTVPAGTFNSTCHFRLTSSTLIPGVTGDFWVAATAGVVLKRLVTLTSQGATAFTQTDALASGTINGVTIRP